MPIPEYDSYGPAGTDISRPPVMTLQQMHRCLLQIVDTGDVAYLPTGRVRTFDEARRWAGWTPTTRAVFDQWAADPDRQTLPTEPGQRMGRSNGALNYNWARL